jgi:hypothetical protein
MPASYWNQASIVKGRRHKTTRGKSQTGYPFETKKSLFTSLMMETRDCSPSSRESSTYYVSTYVVLLSLFELTRDATDDTTSSTGTLREE